MRSLLLGFSLCLLASTSAEAEEKAVAILWKGSPDKAAAQDLSWEQLGKLLALTEFKLPDGYPKLIESKTLPGLKPGFWVWLLGLCAPADAPGRLEHVKRFSPGAYARDVTVPEAGLACPDLSNEPLRARDEVLKLPSGATVRVFAQQARQSTHDSEGEDDFEQTLYHFVLFSRAGELLDAVDSMGNGSIESGHGPSGMRAYRCELTRFELSKKKGQFVVTRHCSADLPACAFLISADERDTIRVDGDTLSLREERLNEVHAECD